MLHMIEDEDHIYISKTAQQVMYCVPWTWRITSYHTCTCHEAVQSLSLASVIAHMTVQRY